MYNRRVGWLVRAAQALTRRYATYQSPEYLSSATYLQAVGASFAEGALLPDGVGLPCY